MNFENHAVISFVHRAETPIAVDKSGRQRLSDAESIATYSDELHYIVGMAKELRAEAEGFVNWTRIIGENINPNIWTATQATYAAKWRERYRATAAEWKASVAKHYKARVDEAVEYFWGPECRTHYPAEVTKSARQELGL